MALERRVERGFDRTAIVTVGEASVVCTMQKGGCAMRRHAGVDGWVPGAM